MKRKMKRFIFIIFLSVVSLHVFSLEILEVRESSYTKIEADINASLRFMFPFSDPSAIALMDLSAGIGYGIIPGRYYIGIAADAAIGLDWLTLFSQDEDDSDSEKEQFGFSLGARIYNSIRMAEFTIKPFFGCDFLFILSPMLYAGMEVSYKLVGLEYAHYFGTEQGNPIRHQLSLKFHFPLEE